MAQGLTSAESPFSMLYVARRRRRLNSAPVAWTVSLVFHGVLFAALWRVVYQETPAPRRLIIAEARLAPTDAAAGEPSGGKVQPERPRSPTPALGGPSLPAQPTMLPPPMPDALPVVAAPAPSSGAVGTMFPVSVITSPSSLAGSRTGTGTGGGGGGGLAGMGPVTSFFGQGGNAYKVVYVVDASASLTSYMKEIVQQMRQSIRDLVPTQEFHIVIAKPGRVEQMDPPRLVPALAKYKQQANSFLDTIRQDYGAADPIEAMRRAFAVHPELIFFLSDGEYLGAHQLAGDPNPAESELERAIAQLNAHGDVKITTIAFAPSPAGSALLNRIAKRNGGHFRVAFKE